MYLYPKFNIGDDVFLVTAEAEDDHTISIIPGVIAEVIVTITSADCDAEPEVCYRLSVSGSTATRIDDGGRLVRRRRYGSDLADKVFDLLDALTGKADAPVTETIGSAPAEVVL